MVADLIGKLKLENSIEKAIAAFQEIISIDHLLFDVYYPDGASLSNSDISESEYLEYLQIAHKSFKEEINYYNYIITR